MRIDPSTLDLKEKVVHINRVTKVVKGGRNFRFSALVVVGDENGHIGVGTGKSIEIPEAIRKGIEDAKKIFLASSIPFLIASGISIDLPVPTPICPFSSPTTTSALNLKFLPPLTTLVTLFM